MGIDDEIRERFKDRADKLAEEVSNLAGQVADKSAPSLFRFMRKFKPILATEAVAVVALAEDVKEVLGDPARFTAGLYGPKMEAVTGPFILGVDDTPLYHHDHAAMDRAVRREDMPVLGDAMLVHCRELVADAGERIDVVTELADPALIRAIDTYFGTPGPDAETQARWARDVFWELFINVNNLAETRERALADAAEWRVHLDALIDARKAALKSGEDVPDDVLTRLLRFQDEDEPNFFDISIRHNILGNIVGWIPTVSNSMARAVNVLLEREDELEGAQAAARAGDRELVGQYVWEALRFSPQNFALLRLVADDTTIAAGTDRETAVKAGSTVYAATLSAMHDDRVIDSPEDFRVGRPWSDYMLFGYGMHTCYGQQIVRHQLPAMMTALLEGAKIERAGGKDGKLKWEGPFPSGLTVRFDSDD
ncbi:MAG TPA: cytochrome P450 [Solirubrobacteraceae bacterium]|jgi:cytochrome P450|nr:cytochrome P450 [Solirubrobacteraceae bacterium]